MKDTSGSQERTKTGSLESKPLRIIYGGSFDPPHLGHRSLVEKVLRLFPEARVDIVVADSPAGAYGQHKTTEADFNQRLEMCRLTFPEARVAINPIEAGLEKPNYTWRTLEALQKQDPQSRWALLMGQDQFESFPGWKKAGELIDKVDLLVVGREGFQSWDETEARFRKDFFPLKALDNGTYAWEGKQGRVYRLTGELSPAASRILRRDIEEQKAWLAPDVQDFIKRNKLYRKHEG